MAINLAVLYGGVGAEREVSLISGRAVINALQRCSPFPVIDCELNGTVLPAGLDPRETLAFIILHGEFGEDGRVQALLEQMQIEFCGCDSQSSKLCYDKIATKQRLTASGVSTVPGVLWDEGSAGDRSALLSEIGLNLVAKPAASGSSIGLACLNGASELDAFLSRVDPGENERWLLEKRIFGREFSVGVLDGSAMEVVEIILPPGRIYDYEQKYFRNDTVYQCPADLHFSMRSRMQRIAESSCEACMVRDYVRVDMMLCNETGEVFVLELNTLPGMTPQSLFPKSAAGKGMGFEELLLKMMDPGLLRLGRRDFTDP